MSEAVANATREHAQNEAAPDAHRGTEPGSPATPFSGGARRIAAVQPREILALQRMAGNAAVARFVARRSVPPQVQRVGPGGGEQTAPAKPGWSTIKALGDDPMELVKRSVDLFEATDTIVPDADFRGDPLVFRPVGAGLMFEDYIVIVDRSAGTMAVLPQSDPPQMINQSIVAIHESATTHMWILFTDDEGHIKANLRTREGVKPIPGAPAGRSRMLIFVPGLLLGDDNAADLRKKIPGTKSGKSGQTPDWAKDQITKLKKRRGKGGGFPPGGPGGVEGGKGTGKEDKGGTGGGGTKDDPKAVPGGDDQEKREGAKPGGPPKKPGDETPKKPGDETPKKPGGGSSATPPPGSTPAPGERKVGGAVPGDPNAPKPRPLQGDPTYKVITTSDDKTHLQITLDRATTWIDMREGEKDGSLDARIDKALEKLQDSRDPEKHGMVAKPATDTGFTPPPKGQTGTVGTADDAKKQAQSTPTAATPGERIPGAKGGANAPAYPARITMGGSRESAPVTVNGATNAFTMEIDYAAMSFGLQDEVFNRMQTIQFYWELLDVTGKTLAEQKTVEKTAKLGSGDQIGAGSGAGRNFGRALDNIAEDQENDLKMMERENWDWEARAAYLAVIGLSNSVRMVGSLIGSFVTLVTQPLNERSIGFDHTGEFLIRGVATPQVSDAARADPDKHVIRASSVAAQPIRVMDINARAKGSISEEDSQLAKLEKDVKEAKDEKSKRAAELKLEAARKATARAGQGAFKASVGGLREQLATARLLKKHMAAHVPDKELSEPELWLEIALEDRGTTVDEMISQLERQLKTMAGEGYEKGEGQGEHEKWVATQSGTFKGGVEYRPRIVLASEETGQVTPVLAMLGEAKDSTDAHPKWRLVDISSPSSRDIYEGESGSKGPGGHSAAIRDAFRNFAENNEYGRGTIAIRLPAQLTSEPAYAGATVDPLMRSAAGSYARFKQRLQDLATVAEVVGLFVTGPLGAAVAAVGGLAGAIVAVDSLVKRARTGHLVEVDTIFDILGVVGGVASIGSVGVVIGQSKIAKLAKAGEKMPSWVGKLEKTEKALHIHGVIGNIQQVIVIPLQLIKELDAIEGATDGQRDAQRALAILRAFKSGTITVIGIMGGIPTSKDKPGAAPGEPEPSAPKQLPAGHNADAADAHAGGTGPAKPPTQAPPDAVGPTAKPAAPSGEPGPGKGADHPTGEGAPKGGDVRTPSPDAVLARALELARQRAAESQQAVEGAGTGQKPAPPADGGTAKPTEPGGTSGTKPAETPGAKPGEGQPGHTGTPAVTGGDTGVTEKPGPDVRRREQLIGLVGKAGAKPDAEAQAVRPAATKTTAAAEPDAVAAVKDSGQFGQVRRDVDAMSNLNDAQRSALKSRLQEARVAVTNEHVGKVLVELQKRFPDLEFHVQDLGTVGFNSDRDITIRVTAKDPGAYAKMGEGERSGMDRRMIQASAEAVPELYKALEAAGFPAERSLDTNFYTELHEGRIRPADKGEATAIVADQQIVSMTELLLNTSHEQWQAFVEQQRAMIEGLRGKKTSERDIAALRKRLDAQVAEAEANARRLVGDSHGHPTPDVRNAALARAREDLVAALKKQPPPSARELRQLMADVKLLEPDAYGTRGAVESVVLGGQSLKGASIEGAQKDGFRTRKQIEHGEGEPGPRRLDPETGDLREVSAEDEVARRRAEGQANVGPRRAGDERDSAWEAGAKRLQVAEAVLGHLLGHLPGPGEARPTDASAAAKNLNRIVEVATEFNVRGKSDGLPHLSAIVAAKGAADSTRAIHKELASWAREGGVKGWAETNGYPLRTDAERLAAFIGWSRQQAMNLTGRIRVKTETGTLHDDVPIGTGRSAAALPAAPAGPAKGTPPPDGGGGTPRPLPSGEAPLATGESDSTPAAPKPATNTTESDPNVAASDPKAAAKAATDETPAPTGGGKTPAPTGPTHDDSGDTSGPSGPKKAPPAASTDPAAPKPPRSALEQTQAEAQDQIAKLRNRLYAWRASTDDPASNKLIDEHLRHLRELAAANRRGEPVLDTLAGVKEDLPRQRKTLRPVDNEQIDALRKRVLKLRDSAKSPDAKKEFERILKDVEALRDRMRAKPDSDPRTSYDAIRNDVKRTGREDYEVRVELTDPNVRAELYAWFSDRLAKLSDDPVGKVLHETILMHIDTADELVLQQSPRGSGVGAASTSAMQKQVLEAVKAGKYPEGYKLAFEAAVSQRKGPWPVDENGKSWEVDHVAELWLGGEDNITNYLALPPELHRAKSDILSDFRAKYRDRKKVQGEQVDTRER